MSATILSWLSGLGISSPTLRPRRMTTARSATSVTWSMRVRDDDDGVALRPQPEDEVEDLARLAHAEGGGRLVEDDDLRGEGGGPGHGDHLALPARHQPDGGRRGRAA